MCTASRRCRHADLLPISSEQGSVRHGVSPSNVHPALRAQGCIALHFSCDLFVYDSLHTGPKTATDRSVGTGLPLVAYLRPRISDDRCRHAHPTLSFLDGAPSHRFPHRMSTCQMCLRLPSLLTHFIPPPFRAAFASSHKYVSFPVSQLARHFLRQILLVRSPSYLD